MQIDIHEDVEDIEYFVPGDTVWDQRLGEVFLARPVAALDVVSQLIEPRRTAATHIAPVIATGIVNNGHHDVFARRLGIEILEAFRSAGPTDDVYCPRLPAVPPLLVIVRIVENAVADLLAIDLMDSKRLALFYFEGPAVAGGDDEFVGDRTWQVSHCLRSLWVQS